MLEDLCGIPVLGVVPYFKDIHIGPGVHQDHSHGMPGEVFFKILQDGSPELKDPVVDVTEPGEEFLPVTKRISPFSPDQRGTSKLICIGDDTEIDPGIPVLHQLIEKH